MNILFSPLRNFVCNSIPNSPCKGPVEAADVAIINGGGPVMASRNTAMMANNWGRGSYGRLVLE